MGKPSQMEMKVRERREALDVEIKDINSQMTGLDVRLTTLLEQRNLLDDILGSQGAEETEGAAHA